MAEHRHTHHPRHHHGDGCDRNDLSHAEAVCAGRGARLTPLRAKVLAALAASDKPVGAYELIDRLAEDGRRPAPITVYRALDFLMENGLAHKLESRNAFLACDHTHDHGAAVVFLICDRCGAVTEAAGEGIGRGLDALVARSGFRAREQIVEIAGECAGCSGAA